MKRIYIEEEKSKVKEIIDRFGHDNYLYIRELEDESFDGGIGLGLMYGFILGFITALLITFIAITLS